MEKRSVILVLMALALVALAPLALAVTSSKITDSSITTVQYNVATPTNQNTLNATTAGANITQLDIAANIFTNHWSAFIGNFSPVMGLATGGVGGIKFLFNATASGSNYESIAASATKNMNWANYKAVNKEVVDFAVNLGTAAADAASNMYNNTATAFAGITLNTTYLNDNSSKPNSQWANGLATTASSGTSYTANSGIENLVFLAKINSSKACNTWINGAAGKVTESSGNCTGGTAATVSAQFQMIVGVNETNSTTDTEAGVQYFFFAINP